MLFALDLDVPVAEKSTWSLSASAFGALTLLIGQDEVLVWLSVWSEVQIVCLYGPVDATVIPKPHHLCLIKIQNDFAFWYGLIQVFLENRCLADLY